MHPDLERDPAERERKSRVMQDITAAHTRGDLHALLQLELEWLVAAGSDATRLSLDRAPGIHRAVETASRPSSKPKSSRCGSIRDMCRSSPTGRSVFRWSSTGRANSNDSTPSSGRSAWRSSACRLDDALEEVRGAVREYPRVGEAAHAPRTAAPLRTTRRHDLERRAMAGFVRQGLRQLQHDDLQSRDVGEVLRVRREQPEVALNRLRGKPQVVDANVWISSGLSKFRSQAAENFGRFDR